MVYNADVCLGARDELASCSIGRVELLPQRLGPCLSGRRLDLGILPIIFFPFCTSVERYIIHIIKNISSPIRTTNCNRELQVRVRI